jgi:hypothetical protein
MRGKHCRGPERCPAPLNPRVASRQISAAFPHLVVKQVLALAAVGGGFVEELLRQRSSR